MSMSEHAVLFEQTNVAVSPEVAPDNHIFHFFAIDGYLNPDEVILKFGLFSFSGVCVTQTCTAEFNANIIPLILTIVGMALIIRNLPQPIQCRYWDVLFLVRNTVT